MDKDRIVIGISMGDPAGIGAEICVKAYENNKFPDNVDIVVVGSAAVVEDAIGFTNSNLEVNKLTSIDKDTVYDREKINVLDLDNIEVGEFTYGTVAENTGKASIEYINKAIDLALEDKIAAVVTGPIHKESINKAGVKHAGHTEIFAERTGTEDYAMMLAENDFRVVHVSTHVSLKQAIENVKTDRVYKVIKLADNAMKSLGIEEPRIAVAGLNPHAGENGLFGNEEAEEITPAIEKAVKENIDAEGPIPPDTVFSKARGGQYDIVVVMYHDQGHIPMKTVGFQYDEVNDKWLNVSGVNVTLGLPIIRTSVDHGVAFGKAGDGRANEESMVAAIEMAIDFASN